MQHCWEILRHHEKWGRSTHEPRTSRVGNASGSEDVHNSINLSDDGVQLQQTQDQRYKRTTGREASKEKKKKAAESDPIIEEILETSRRSLEQIKEGQSRHENFWAHHQAKKSARINWQQKKWEAEMMEKDITDMTPTKKEYFKGLKLDILEEQRLRSVSRSLSFSDGNETVRHETPTSDRNSSRRYDFDVRERSQNYQNLSFDSPGIQSCNIPPHRYQEGGVSGQHPNYNDPHGVYSEFSQTHMYSTPRRTEGTDNHSTGKTFGFSMWNTDLNN